jgi:esterase/lipase superfamily enzyme
VPKYWMISDRTINGDTLGTELAPTTYWVSDKAGIDKLGNWTRVGSAEEFRKQLVDAASDFPAVPAEEQHDQKHVTIFVHGYNNSWDVAAKRYKSICDELFSGNDSMGLCMFFTWPSNGEPADYLPDRRDAQRAAPDLAEVLDLLYDWLAERQRRAADNRAEACRAKTSIIAHSMGNFVLQKAMQYTWTRKNRPLLVSLINQLLMVAADVDNDLFKGGEAVTESDGDAIANLTYRVTALYSGRDPILGMSAGLKHFGKRRLGRAGLDQSYAVPDNVWDVDCSSLIPANAENVHSAYFESPKVIELMRQVLRGIDRNVLVDQGVAPPPPGLLVTQRSDLAAPATKRTRARR